MISPSLFLQFVSYHSGGAARLGGLCMSRYEPEALRREAYDVPVQWTVMVTVTVTAKLMRFALHWASMNYAHLMSICSLSSVTSHKRIAALLLPLVVVVHTYRHRQKRGVLTSATLFDISIRQRKFIGWSLGCYLECRWKRDQGLRFATLNIYPKRLVKRAYFCVIFCSIYKFICNMIQAVQRVTSRC